MHYGGEVFERPVYQGVEVREKGSGSFGEGVFDARGDFGVDFAVDEAVLLEGAQCGGEHLLGDVGHGIVDGVEAHAFAVGEGIEYEH